MAGRWIVKRTEMDRTSDGPLRTYTKFRIVQRTGIFGHGGTFTDTEPRVVLEDGLLLHEAKVRVKYWRNR